MLVPVLDTYTIQPLLTAEWKAELDFMVAPSLTGGSANAESLFQAGAGGINRQGPGEALNTAEDDKAAEDEANSGDDEIFSAAVDHGVLRILRVVEYAHLLADSE